MKIALTTESLTCTTGGGGGLSENSGLKNYQKIKNNKEAFY